MAEGELDEGSPGNLMFKTLNRGMEVASSVPLFSWPFVGSTAMYLI